MAIPNENLVKWSKPGLNQNSKETYAKMRSIIESNLTNTEVFLQGSYANSTNVRDNSDIDVVVIFNGWNYNSYDKNDVRYARDFLYNTLNGKNNFIFNKGNKTIKYAGNNNYVPADIVPCIKYYSNGNEGVIVYDHRSNTNIISYPKQHKKNGENKSGDTDGNYKKAVRMFKNTRNYAVKKGILNENTCPSYCIECLLYNVPESNYSGNEREVFYSTIKWLYDRRSSLGNLVRQNGIQYLFGDSISSWNKNDAQKSIEKIAYVWDKWGNF